MQLHWAVLEAMLLCGSMSPNRSALRGLLRIIQDRVAAVQSIEEAMPWRARLVAILY